MEPYDGTSYRDSRAVCIFPLFFAGLGSVSLSRMLSSHTLVAAGVYVICGGFKWFHSDNHGNLLVVARTCYPTEDFQADNVDCAGRSLARA